MVERGKLNQAAQCLERAAALAPHQDYVQRHLSIVRNRINKESVDDTEVFDDSFWNSNTKDKSFNADVASSGQFLSKTDSVFTNHAAVHNHIGSKQSNTDTLNNHIIHLKGPSKPARTMSNVASSDSATDTHDREQAAKQTAAKLNNIVEPTTDKVFDKIISADVTKLNIRTQERGGTKHTNSDQFNRSASATATIGGKQGIPKQTKEQTSALS